MPNICKYLTISQNMYNILVEHRNGDAPDNHNFELIVPLNPKMYRGSTGNGLTTAKRGKNQQAGNFRRLVPTTLVMGT